MGYGGGGWRARSPRGEGALEGGELDLVGDGVVRQLELLHIGLHQRPLTIETRDEADGDLGRLIRTLGTLSDKADAEGDPPMGEGRLQLLDRLVGAVLIVETLSDELPVPIYIRIATRRGQPREVDGCARLDAELTLQLHAVDPGGDRAIVLTAAGGQRDYGRRGRKERREGQRLEELS